MGASQSLGPFPAQGSIIVEGEGGGAVRGNPNPDYKNLVPTAFSEVLTLYDAFQYVLFDPQFMCITLMVPKDTVSYNPYFIFYTFYR